MNANEVIANLPFFSNHIIREVTEVEAGLSNQVYFVKTDVKTSDEKASAALNKAQMIYVVKQFTADSHLEGVLLAPPSHQVARQDVSAQLGLAPAHFAFDSQYALQVMEYINGKELYGSQLSFDHIAVLANALAQLHNQTFDLAPIKASKKLENYRSLLITHSPDLSDIVTQNIEALKRIEQNPMYGAGHGDLNVKNILWTKASNYSNCLFLDWEYSSVTDVRSDLANLVCELGLSTAQEPQLIQQYCSTQPNNLGPANAEVIANTMSPFKSAYYLFCLTWLFNEANAKNDKLISELKKKVLFG